MEKVAYNRQNRDYAGPASIPKKIREFQGEFTIGGALTVLLVSILLVLFISVLGVINTSMKLHSVAADLSRYIEVRGMVDGAVYSELDRLASVTNVNVETRNITGTFSSGSKLQFGSDFTIYLTATGHIGVGGILNVPVPLETRVTGRSERYWK